MKNELDTKQQLLDQANEKIEDLQSDMKSRDMNLRMMMEKGTNYFKILIACLNHSFS